MYIKKVLGRKIKKLRVKLGLTQNELAKMVGISQRSLSGIEIGKNFVTAETLERILDSLKVSLDELFTLEHLRPANELADELCRKIASISDKEKIALIYKIVRAIETE